MNKQFVGGIGLVSTEIQYRDDVHQGEPGHPQCCFFEQFPSSADPYETFHGALLCQMSVTEKDAEVCKGDYLKCPLAYGGKNATDELPFEPPTPMHDATPSLPSDDDGDEWIPF
jgi:hypothetical protein